MTKDDAEYIAELEARLTSDLDEAIECLIAAMPEGTDERELSLLLLDKFPELQAKNKAALAELGLARMIIEMKHGDH